LSSEKEVVNFWLNRKGYFTIRNLKSRNKDIGIIALKFDDGSLTKIMHIEVFCSLTGSADQNFIMNRIIHEKFNDKDIINVINKYTKNMRKDLDVDKVVILNSLSKAKNNIKERLVKKGIIMFEFEDVLSDTMKELKTEYFKDDVIRSLQIVKFLLMSNPKKFVEVLCDTLSQQKMREFLSELLNREEIIKEFRKINDEKMSLILKNARIKPEKLAEILEKDVLNRRTRKTFVDSLMKQQKVGKVYKKIVGRKKETPLNKFFN